MRQVMSIVSKVKRLKVPAFIYRHLQGNPNCSGLQFEAAY